MTTLYRIKLDNTVKYYTVCDGDMPIVKGKYYVVKRDVFQECGKLVEVTEGSPAMMADIRKVDEPPRIVRLATEEDLHSKDEMTAKAQSVEPLVRRIVFDLKLPMKVLNVAYSLDGRLCVVLFAAENRVDFRELLKQLASNLGSRIELRQVSVRDETAAIGGIGCCGQQMCCCRFLNDFASINVKLAKDQDIPLTSSNISGICGRLKCCLKYEHDTYIDLQKGMPRRGDIVSCDEGCGRVCDRNLISRRLSIAIEKGPNSYRTVQRYVGKDELKVVKGRGSDETEPIQDDLEQLNTTHS